MNKKKWTVAGQVLASRGERQKDVMDIFQVDHEKRSDPMFDIDLPWTDIFPQGRPLEQ